MVSSDFCGNSAASLFLALYVLSMLLLLLLLLLTTLGKTKVNLVLVVARRIATEVTLRENEERGRAKRLQFSILQIEQVLSEKDKRRGGGGKVDRGERGVRKRKNGRDLEPSK